MGAAALALFVGLATGLPASAEAGTTTPVAYVSQPTATGLCNATLFTTSTEKATGTSIYAVFENQDAGFSCNAWLERSTDNGASWSDLSGIHTLNSDPNHLVDVTTYDYYDGPGYLARACFQYLGWASAAVHCTSAW